MATRPASGLEARSFQSWIDSIIGQNEDPRVGSGREGADGGTISATNGSKGASLAKLGSTFIPIAVYVSVCLIIFIIARRKLHRVYAPRTIPQLRAPEAPATRLPDGWFNWIKPFFQTPDTVVLNHGSLDGFFFLRYLKMLRNICFVGCLIAWPLLFPLHATGGNGQQELELLTMGNVKNPNRLYANALVAWLLFGKHNKICECEDVLIRWHRFRPFHSRPRIDLLHQYAPGLPLVALLRAATVFSHRALYQRADPIPRRETAAKIIR